jgi:F0F1-type ATP synthase delta subunit
MDNLLSAVKTTGDRNRLYSEIELVSQAMYKEEELKKVLNAGVSKQLGDYLSGDLSHEMLSAKLSDLKKSLGELKVVKVTIAYEAPESTIQKIIGLVRQNFGEKTILELGVEPLILGGLIFEYGGLYRDYTLKTKLSEVFKNKKEEILSNL